MTQQWEREIELFPSSQVTDNVQLNGAITIDEVQRSIIKCRLGKAVGIDNVPNEILKIEKLTPILHKLFNVCFVNNVIPSEWYKNDH